MCHAAATQKMSAEVSVCDHLQDTLDPAACVLGLRPCAFPGSTAPRALGQGVEVMEGGALVRLSDSRALIRADVCVSCPHP